MRFPTYSPRQGDDMAKAHQSTLPGGHYRWIADSFNSSLAHRKVPLTGADTDPHILSMSISGLRQIAMTRAFSRRSGRPRVSQAPSGPTLPHGNGTPKLPLTRCDDPGTRCAAPRLPHARLDLARSLCALLGRCVEPAAESVQEFVSSFEFRGPPRRPAWLQIHASARAMPSYRACRSEVEPAQPLGVECDHDCGQ